MIDPKQIDLPMLRVFDALMQTRHVTQAGVNLGLSQPSVSFALNKLRALTQDELFVRSPGGMTPTPLAQQMADTVRQILDMVDNDLLGAPRFDPASAQRSFTLSMSDIGEIVFLPYLTRQLRAIAPNISVQAISLPPLAHEAALLSGDVDLSVGYYPDFKKANYYQQFLYSDNFVCVMRKDHPLTTRPFDPAAFVRADHLVVKSEGRSEEVFERYLAGHGVRRPVKLVIPHFMSIPHVLRDTDLIATVPRSCAAALARAGDVVVQESPVGSPLFEIKQHWHARFHRDEPNRWLRGLIYEAFARPPRPHKTIS